MNNIEKIYTETPDPSEFSKAYIEYLSQILISMNTDHIGRFIDTFLEARKKGATIYFIGNGGSASTASHFANDISIGTNSLTKPFRAISLCDNISILTAIGNDYGYDQVFVKQLETLMHEDDVVVAISASGNSPNVIKAVEYANKHGAITVGLTGFDGGMLKKICRKYVHVPSLKGEYGPVEDAHMILDHLVGSFLKGLCCSENQVKL